MGESGSRAARLRQLMRRRWRAWLRALHRDIGYLLVGLTFIYAISGIAVNHVGEDFDPNFKTIVDRHTLAKPLPKEEAALEASIVDALGIPPDEVQAAYFAPSPEEVAAGDAAGPVKFEVSHADGAAVLDMSSGVITSPRKEARFFLRMANWLHVQRGKPAWNYIGDAYAILLLYLATSGMFMLKGRKGFIGRGGVLVMVGISIPVLYVHFSGAAP